MDRDQVVSHAKANKYQVFIVKGEGEYKNDEFYVLGLDPFKGFGKESNEVLAINLHYTEGEDKETIQKARMLDMKDDCKNFGIDLDKVNWNPARL